MSPEESKPLASHLKAALSEQELSAAWEQIEASRNAKGHRTAWRRGVLVAFATAAAVLATVGLWPRPAGELTQSDGQAFHRVGAAETVRLADDSQIVTTHGGTVEVLENSKTKLALHLLSGAARFEVTPGTGRHWSVEAGELSVEVTGTVFTVERSAEGASVTVERGTVIVRGSRVPDGVRRLAAGEELTVGAAARAMPAPAPPATAPEPAAAPVPSPPPPAPPHTVAPAPPATVETPASVMAESDRLRREGRRAEANALLESVAERWPASPEAPLAALTVANLLQDSGDARLARVWYQRALDLGLSGPLADTAKQALSR